MSDDGHLRLGTHPTLHSVASDQHDERGALAQGCLENADPSFAGSNPIFVAKNAKPNAKKG